MESLFSYCVCVCCPSGTTFDRNGKINAVKVLKRPLKVLGSSEPQKQLNGLIKSALISD